MSLSAKNTRVTAPRHVTGTKSRCEASSGQRHHVLVMLYHSKLEAEGKRHCAKEGGAVRNHAALPRSLQQPGSPSECVVARAWSCVVVRGHVVVVLARRACT